MPRIPKNVIKHRSTMLTAGRSKQKNVVIHKVIASHYFEPISRTEQIEMEMDGDGFIGDETAWVIAHTQRGV